MSVQKINEVLDEMLGRRFGMEGDESTPERQLIQDILLDYYAGNKDRHFVTESLKHLVAEEKLSLFELFSLIGGVDALKEEV